MHRRVRKRPLPAGRMVFAMDTAGRQRRPGRTADSPSLLFRRRGARPVLRARRYQRHQGEPRPPRPAAAWWGDAYAELDIERRDGWAPLRVIDSAAR